MQANPLSTWFPAREPLDRGTPGAAAIPAVWTGHGGGWDSHGSSTSMQQFALSVCDITACD